MPDESPLLRRVSAWSPGELPREIEPDSLRKLDPTSESVWFDLACGVERVSEALDTLAPHCSGLDQRMLLDLFTPDEEPEGASYQDGSTRLASSFAVQALRPQQKQERGTAQRAGVLVFSPIELLAGECWLITCAHPTRTFQGAEPIEQGSPPDGTELYRAVGRRWSHQQATEAGDLGVAVMHELALTYRPTCRDLGRWLEDWELSLYVEDDLENRDQLPELWGLMAVLRNWLSVLNRPGMRADVEKAWLPAADHQAVIAVDERIDKSLAELAKLSETLRQSFGLLHLEQAEEQRRHSERMQHRIEAAAAVFLVPTLIVGFYGANTWVPGQGRHWGFWVMVAALIVLSVCALLAVLHMQRRSHAAAEKAALERKRMRGELLRGATT